MSYKYRRGGGTGWRAAGAFSCRGEVLPDLFSLLPNIPTPWAIVQSLGICLPGARVYLPAGNIFFGQLLHRDHQGHTQRGTVFDRATLLYTGLAISSFGEDDAGNLYVADLQTGNVQDLRTVEG